MYADFNFYQGAYFGNVIQSDGEYKCLAVEASAYLDRMTDGQIDASDATALQQVKLAECAIVDVLRSAEEDASDAIVSSESVGNHTKSYSISRKTDADRETEKWRKACLYLSRTGLLYRGMG